MGANGGTPKVPRKSTHIDMTAFCDVSFLLLTFFMLATKFKTPDPVEIQVPNSVSTKSVPEDNVISITFDTAGRVFLGLDMDKQQLRSDLWKELNKKANLGLSDADISKLVSEPFWGFPLAGVRAFLNGDYGVSDLPGIPVGKLKKDPNELTTWIAVLTDTYKSKSKPDIIIKGDSKSSYSSFSKVIEALKKNRLFSFKLVTGQEPIPTGTPLYASQQKNN